MKMKSKYILPILGIAAAVGIGVGASPRAVSSVNDIIFGENGPIKLISPHGVVVLSTKNQVVNSNDFVVTKSDISKKKISDLLVKRYPFFILDLNNGLSIGDTLALGESGRVWFGVELKASTNNFGMALYPILATDDEKEPCFWSCTDSSFGLSTMDGCLAFTTVSDRVIGSNPYFDNRGWVKVTGSIALMFDIENENTILPRKIGILVVPEMLNKTHDNPDWLRSDNEEIVWSYMRTDLTGYETNATGKAIWTMCEPACWFSKIPEWASKAIVP